MYKKLILTLFILIFLLVFIFPSTGKLVDIYKQGKFSMEADPEFAKNTNWDQIFGETIDNPQGRSLDTLKNLAIAKDGSIFVSNYNNYTVIKFDKNGNFLKKFGKKGGKKGEFIRRPEIYDITDKGEVIVKAWHGGIHFFDPEGKFIKSHSFDYMPDDILAIGDTKIAIAGATVYSAHRMKEFVEIQDLATKTRQQIIHTIYDISKVAVWAKVDQMTVSISYPLSRINTFVNQLKDGNIIVGFSNSPDVSIFSPTGQKIKTWKLNFLPPKVTEEEKQDYIESLKKSIKNQELPKKLLKLLKTKPGFFPEYKPYYYKMLVDSDGNLLFFTFPEENNKKKYNILVYSPQGEFICKTLLDQGPYNLYLNPRQKTWIFDQGNLYALVSLKDEKDGYLRIIKVKLAKD